jgi:hypothetical protein
MHNLRTRGDRDGIETRTGRSKLGIGTGLSSDVDRDGKEQSCVNQDGNGTGLGNGSDRDGKEQSYVNQDGSGTGSCCRDDIKTGGRSCVNCVDQDRSRNGCNRDRNETSGDRDGSETRTRRSRLGIGTGLSSGADKDGQDRSCVNQDGSGTGGDREGNKNGCCQDDAEAALASARTGGSRTGFSFCQDKRTSFGFCQDGPAAAGTGTGSRPSSAAAGTGSSTSGRAGQDEQCQLLPGQAAATSAGARSKRLLQDVLPKQGWRRDQRQLQPG